MHSLQAGVCSCCSLTAYTAFHVCLLVSMLLPLCRFSKTASGVTLQELGLGRGKEARVDSRVEVDFVLRQAC